MVVEDRRIWRNVRAKGGSHAAWPSLVRPRGFSHGPPLTIAHNVFGTSSASATCTIKKIDNHRHPGKMQHARASRRRSTRFGLIWRTRRGSKSPPTRDPKPLGKIFGDLIERVRFARTLRWREMDSNFRFRVRKLAIRLELN